MLSQEFDLVGRGQYSKHSDSRVWFELRVVIGPYSYISRPLAASCMQTKHVSDA
jgi:hypothetical protein